MAITTSRNMTGAQAIPETSRCLAAGAIVGPMLFTLAWIVLGVLQPSTRTEYGVMGGVSGAISNPVSGLGVGSNAELFNATFVLSGILTLAGVVGIFQTVEAGRQVAARWTCAALLALSPIGLALAGIFTLASSIVLHNVAALLLFATPIVGFLAAGFYFRRIPGGHRCGNWLIAGSPLTLLLIVLFVSTFNLATITAGRGVAGLTERVLLIEIQAWYVAMGWLAFRSE